ncbi:putative membrane protein [Escherichia coli 3-267-03_S3_C2]|nr:putative membrane protein [Escherichia coli 3-267-03_S3_C2]
MTFNKKNSLSTIVFISFIFCFFVIKDYKVVFIIFFLVFYVVFFGFYCDLP